MGGRGRSGRLRTGEPDIRFGGNQVSVDLPTQIASGWGDATVHFVWDGMNLSGAVCGDMDVTETVGGDVDVAFGRGRGSTDG